MVAVAAPWILFSGPCRPIWRQASAIIIHILVNSFRSNSPAAKCPLRAGCWIIFRGSYYGQGALAGAAMAAHAAMAAEHRFMDSPEAGRGAIGAEKAGFTFTSFCRVQCRQGTDQGNQDAGRQGGATN